MVGKTLQHYEILEPLGAGGMGEVYLAQDPRLGRKVAIKVLPGEFASDPGRLARFKQEARAAAALNHPHIAVVHDVGTEGGIHFMVQEYLVGQSLRERLTEGALPLDQALELAIEVAEALVAAHKAGIVHRDLKPDNIFLTEEGHAKVLDFGLAKLKEVVAPEGGELTASPTALGTVAGQVVGTVGYMAPEQVNGLQVDQRADLFAFGCVLYEMTTGRRAFAGENVHETLARILSDAPAPIGDIRESAPPELGRIVRKALAKHTDRRYQTALDLGIDLRQLRESVAAGTAVTPATQQAPIEPNARPAARGGASWTTVGVVALMAALAAGTAIWALMGNQVPGHLAGQFRVQLPSGTTVPGDGGLAVSPDGGALVFVADDSQARQLYSRRLDQLDAVALPGTMGASRPFFSPDGESVAFNVDGDLRVVSLTGGESFTLCEDCASRDSDGTWYEDRIIFDRDGSLWEIPASGAVSPDLLAEPDAERGEAEYDRPYFLPTGDAIVFELRRADLGPLADGAIALLDLESRGVPDIVIIVEEGSNPVYLSSGHVLHTRGTTLYGQELDLERLEPIGAATPILQGVGRGSYSGSSRFAGASTGVFAYLRGTALTGQSRTLVWVDEDGTEEPLDVPAGEYDRVRISPDGRKVAVMRRVEQQQNIRIWDTETGTFPRLTRVGFNLSPAWSRDSSTIAFASAREGTSGRDIYVAPLDRSEAASLLYAAEESLWPIDQLEDGRMIVHVRSGQDDYDVMLLDVESDSSLQPILDSDAYEGEARLSPVGDWLAYRSDEAGQQRVYIRRLSEPQATWAVSPPGGGLPAWSPDGSVLYYQHDGFMWAASLQLDTGAQVLDRQPLFSTAPYLLANGLVPYDVHPRTGRFLMIKKEVPSTEAVDRTGPESSPHIVVVLNFEELKQLGPTSGSR